MITIRLGVGMLLFAFMQLAGWPLARAERVSMTMRPDLTAIAEYRAGRADKPVILILHGFLQTADSPVIFSLTEGLAGEGYGVLAPTMTLGVTHRRTSLACEAIHTHTLNDDIIEIDRWVQWLKRRHNRPIVLIGHSLGSVTLLAYLDRYADTPVRKTIGVSIMEGRLTGNPKDQEKKILDLKQRIRNGQREPVRQPYSFCSTFNAIPESLLSYLEWSPARVMALSRKHKSRLIYIMGGRDDRLGPGWVEGLVKTGVTVRIIPGANHFMDGEYEFDLLESVIGELKDLRAE